MIFYLLSVYISILCSIIFLLVMLFFYLSKSEKWGKDSSSPFECGFTSYYFSRFSFSIHYFILGLIFLFLDLELCFLFPLFNQSLESFKSWFLLVSVMAILLVGLLEEWGKGKLDWKY